VSDLNAKLADLALEAGYCAPEQIESALAEVARLRDLGIEKNLADLLFERELVDERQREKLARCRTPSGRAAWGWCTAPATWGWTRSWR
jgi:hypothetical protein